MSDKLFTPTYSIDGVEYRGKPRMADEVEVRGGKSLDPNRYATKKTIAQGMLDIALLTANASQLKYVLQIGEKHEFYGLMLGLIVTSLVLQGLTAVLLSVLSRLNIKHRTKQGPADIINHIVLGLNLLILAIDTIKMGLNNGYQPIKTNNGIIP